MLRLIFLVASVAACGSAFADQKASELPPTDHPDPIFTDANGCVYIRAELQGWTLWVQRLDASGRPDCAGVMAPKTGQQSAST